MDNNINNVPVGTPLDSTPVNPEPVASPTPVVSEVTHVAPATPVAPVTPEPVAPVAPQAPVEQVQQPVAQVTPQPVSAMTPPVPEFTPATNPVPPVQGLNTQPQVDGLTQVTPPTPETGYIPPVTTPQPNNQKKNYTGPIVVTVVILFIALAIIAAVIGSKDKDEDTKTTTTTTTTSTTVTTTENTTTSTTTTTTTTQNVIGTTSTSTTQPIFNDNLALNQAKYKNVTISFPATAASFEGTGWEWDSSYTEKELKTGYTTSGGRIGKYPGGVVVGIYNLSGETKKYKDCTIDSGTFYNPQDGSENVTFIGGLNYNSTIDQVKQTMASKGYKNVKESTYENSVYLKYYKDDNQDNYRDYIEFYYYKDEIKSISISVGYN